jgi:regulatory protein
MFDAPDDIYRRALNSAIRILTIREHSTAELTQKLKHRGYAEDVIQRVLMDCRQRNYLDDRRTARQMLDSMKRRGFGIHRIRSELLKKGLGGEGNEFDPVEDMPSAEESSVALRVALKKWKSLQRETEPNKRRLRLIRFLRSRGFSEEALFDVLKSVQK